MNDVAEDGQYIVFVYYINVYSESVSYIRKIEVKLATTEIFAWTKGLMNIIILINICIFFTIYKIYVNEKKNNE